jgi:hypothetical protein
MDGKTGGDQAGTPQQIQPSMEPFLESIHLDFEDPSRDSEPGHRG